MRGWCVPGAELHLFAVVAAADMLHDFMGSVQSAQSKLSALCTCVEDYVEKMLFLDQYVADEKAMDAACNQVGCKASISAAARMSATCWVVDQDMSKTGGQDLASRRR